MNFRDLWVAAALIGGLGQATAKPTVDDLVARFLAATGGAEQWAALTSLKVSSRSPAFSFDAAWKQPNRLRFDAWSDAGPDTDTRAFDGTSGWRVSSREGSTQPRTMSLEEVSELRDELDWMRELVDYKAKGHKITLQGTATVDDQAVYRLELTRTNGAVVQILLDVKTGLEVQRIKWVRSPGGDDTEFVWPVGDYRTIGGLLLPHQIGPATRTYQVNPAIPDAHFQRPGTTASKANGLAQGR